MSGGSANAPFFVMGAARSGSTLLRLMLNRHPRLAVPPESHFLLPIFDEIPIDRTLTAREVERTARLVVEHPRFRTWQVAPERLEAAFRELGPCRLRDLVDRAFRLQIERSGKPRWGDKTPWYCACWRRIAALFPDSRLLHLVRDGRDVSLSLAKVGWHGPSEYQRARYWGSRVAIARQCEEELGAERCLVLRYEELVLATEETLGKVCDFLGERYDPAMARFYEDAFEHLSDFDGPVASVHGKLRRPPSRDDVERWRHGASRARILFFESIAGPALDQVPYPRYFSGYKRLLTGLTRPFYTAFSQLREPALQEGPDLGAR